MQINALIIIVTSTFVDICHLRSFVIVFPSSFVEVYTRFKLWWARARAWRNHQLLY